MRSLAGVAVAVGALVAASGGCAADGAPAARHLIYLHGRIVQDEQSARPRHPRFGYYELEDILRTFRDRGFVVTGEIRPKSASVSDSADEVVKRVRRLLDSGVPPDHITVVGASMGAAIALAASARLQNPDLRFCVLGACLSANVRGLLAAQGNGPSGRVLSIREASDELSARCPRWQDDAHRLPGLIAREVVVETGLEHGFLYRPLREWVDPVVAWATAPNPGE